MKLLSISDDDLRLLNALKPFLSSKGQEVVEVFSTVINVFRPSDPEEKINIEALNSLLAMVTTPSGEEEKVEEKEQEKVGEKEQEAEAESATKASKTQELENLLNTLAEKQKQN
ncbi:MAG: hypothetical protein L5655_03765 [Thermosediminibacteraceae bacterium]|nr:hypothetical protein [Thermosediminibacteraceae bacterium]